MINRLEVLSKLEFSQEEREDIQNFLDDMEKKFDKLKEIDTENIEPMSHLFPINNIFREYIVQNSNDREAIFFNTSDKKNGYFRVPKTID